MISDIDLKLIAGLKTLRKSATADALKKKGDEIAKDADELCTFACQNFSAVKEVLTEEQYKLLAGWTMLSIENPCLLAFALETLDNVIIPLCQTYKTVLLAKGGNA